MRRVMLPLLVAVALLASAPAASAEWFVDGMIGAAITQKDTIEFTVFDERFVEDVNYTSSPSFGLRAGYWFEALPWLGVAVEASYFRPLRDTQVFPLTGLLMARYGLMKDSEFVHGRLQPYAAFGAGLFISSIDGSLAFNDAADTSTDIGIDARLGVAYHLERQWAIFAEYRYTHVKPTFDIETFSGTTPADTTFNTHHILIGVSYRF